MKIAVLGANGFVGSRIAKHLDKTNKVVKVTRKTLDLLDSSKVKQYLDKEQFDTVINAAAVMTDNTALADTRNNLGIFMNFYNNRTLFNRFINLGSGAEFDRTQNIEQAKEQTIYDCLPQDSYGFGQNIKSRLAADTPGFYNLRIFNCFGKGEITTRIFPRLLENKQDTFDITDDRYFDYFSIQDLCTVVENFVVKTQVIFDVNCVYKEKYLISQVAQKFIDAHSLKSKLNIVSTSRNNYTGSSENLYSLDIPLQGLDQGIRNYD